MTRFLFGCAIGSLFTLSAVSVGIYAAMQTQQAVAALNPVHQLQEWLP